MKKILKFFVITSMANVGAPPCGRPLSSVCGQKGRCRGLPLQFCLAMTWIFLIFLSNPIYASEVIPEMDSQVIVREHPKTGKPYIVIAAKDSIPAPFFPDSKKFSRPDYHLLDPKVKLDQIPYDGPYSDSKRIYIFAATLATLGVGGLVGAAVMPASAAGGAASGGAGYLAAGGAVAAGTVTAAVANTAPNPKNDEFVQASESKSIYKENRKRL